MGKVVTVAKLQIYFCKSEHMKNQYPAGRYTYGAENIDIGGDGSGGRLSIGSFCSIGDNVQVWLGWNHRTDWISTWPFGLLHQNVFGDRTFDINENPYTNGDVIIGNDVWIASNVVIMSGVVIGNGAVVANNSHVVKSVDPYTVVGGNPAKLIRHRFGLADIRMLLRLAWWEKPDSEIREIAPLLSSSNLKALFDRYNL